jgi:hypothetical protein
VIEGGRNVTHSLLANWNSGTILPDVLRDNSLLLASQALDDFRRVGEHDLAINHGITRTNRVVRESSNVTSA